MHLSLVVQTGHEVDIFISSRFDIVLTSPSAVVQRHDHPGKHKSKPRTTPKFIIIYSHKYSDNTTKTLVTSHAVYTSQRKQRKEEEQAMAPLEEVRSLPLMVASLDSVFSSPP